MVSLVVNSRRAAMMGGTALLIASALGSGVAAARAPGPPQFGRTINVVRLSGRVLVSAPGGRAAILRSPRQIPVGSTVDTMNGKVRLIVAARRGRATYTAEVSLGQFVVTQSRNGNGMTDLRLTGGDQTACPKAHIAKKKTWGSMKLKAPSGGRHAADMSAAAVGRFRAIGTTETGTNVGAAAWTVTNCPSGGVASATGTTSVSAHAGTVTAQTDAVTTEAHSLSPHETWTISCVRSGQQPVTSGYCEALLVDATPGDVTYVPALFARTASDSFELCSAISGSPRSCQTWAFSAPGPDGYRSGLVACGASHRGTYAFSWRIDGQPIGLRLPPFVVPSNGSSTFPCLGELGSVSYPVGDGAAPLHANSKSVNRYVLPTAAWIEDLSLYLETTISVPPAQGTIQGVVYSNVNGAPGTLVGATAALTIRSTDADDYRDLEFRPALQLEAGTYWFGVVVHAPPNLAVIRYEHGAMLDFSTSPFSGVVGDPFGAYSGADERMSLVADYTVAPPGG